jgi:hypothetical protein
MLHHLPLEIIVHIGHCLQFKDKLALSQTCHRIHAVITHHCLYQDLNLTGGSDKIRKVVRKFKSKQLNGSQVKHLNISLDTLSNQLYRRLPVVFPNVTRIRNAQGSEGQRHEYTLEPMTQWATKLEEYDMRHGQLQLDRLMLKHSFTRITSLVLSPQVDILACLPNVPLLKDFTIFNFELDVEYLESIHAVSANVTRFKLQSGLVRMQANKRLPHDIQPLVNLTSLTISSDVAIADKECFFLDYICTKYTKLLDFSFLSTFKSTLLSRRRTLGFTIGGKKKYIYIYFNPFMLKSNIYTQRTMSRTQNLRALVKTI